MKRDESADGGLLMDAHASSVRVMPQSEATPGARASGDSCQVGAGPIAASEPRLEAMLRELAGRLAEADDPCARRLVEFALQSRTIDDMRWLLAIIGRILVADDRLSEYATMDAVQSLLELMSAERIEPL